MHFFGMRAITAPEVNAESLFRRSQSETDLELQEEYLGFAYDFATLKNLPTCEEPIREFKEDK